LKRSNEDSDFIMHHWFHTFEVDNGTNLAARNGHLAGFQSPFF